MKLIIRPPEQPTSPWVMGGLSDIFQDEVCGVIRRAVTIGNGFSASENQSIGLVHTLGLSNKHTLYIAGVNMPNSYDFCPCSCYRRRKCVSFLPKEIIFKILLCLPAEILYNVLRYVCREWYNLINDPVFVDAHLQKAPKGILMQSWNRLFYTKYTELGKYGLEITNLRLSQGCVRDGRNFDWFQPVLLQERFYGLPCHKRKALFPGKIYGCCNGLVLFSDLNCYGLVHIANLSLKQWITLPPIENVVDIGCIGKFGLAYAATSRKYKVVHVYDDHGCQFEIVTVGVDGAWRHLGDRHIPCSTVESKNSKLFYLQTLSTGQFIHWAWYPFVLSLDVEDESFHMTSFPGGYCQNTKKNFLAMDNYLSLIALSDEHAWELWGLMEVKKGSWSKLQKINLATPKHMIQQKYCSTEFDLFPVCLQNNGDLILFKVRGKWKTYIVYDVKTGASDLFEFCEDETWGGRVFCFPHARSLVSLRDNLKSST